MFGLSHFLQPNFVTVHFSISRSNPLPTFFLTIFQMEGVKKVYDAMDRVPDDDNSLSALSPEIFNFVCLSPPPDTHSGNIARKILTPMWAILLLMACPASTVV